MVARGYSFLAYFAKLDRKWITTQEVPKKQIPHKWCNEIPLSTPPMWPFVWHKHKAQKDVVFFDWLSIKQWMWMDESGWSSTEINKSCPHCGVVCNLWSQRNTCSSFVYWPNTCGSQWRKHTKLCETICLTMVDLSGKGLLWNWEKTLDVAYEDVLNKFDLIWCVKGLIVTRSNLVVTWTIRPQIGIISRGPISLGLFPFPLQFHLFSNCIKKTTKQNTHSYVR